MTTGPDNRFTQSPARHAPSVSVTRFPSTEAMNRSAAAIIDAAARQSTAARGVFSLAVSGGKTPARLFELLAGIADFPWAATHLFWVDERLAPPDAPESNYRLVHETLLSRVAIPAGNIHAMAEYLAGAEEGASGGRGANGPPDPPYSSASASGHPLLRGSGGALPPRRGSRGQRPLVSLGEAAARYEAHVRRVFASALGQPGVPCFDCIHLGMGADGHTASLFSGQPGLEEGERLIIAVDAPGAKPPVPRLSMTLPLINNARLALFLVAGKDKQAALADILDGPALSALPAGRVRPREELRWLVSEE